MIAPLPSPAETARDARLLRRLVRLHRMTDDRQAVERLLAEQQILVDDETRRAVEEWHRAWLREWEWVRAFDLRDEDPPAPLWCWPP